MQRSNDQLRSKHRPELQYVRKTDHQRGVTMARLERAQMHWSLFLEQSRLLWKPNLSFSKPRHGYLLRRLLNTKLKMRSWQLHSCQVERLVRAFGVEVLDSVRKLHYRHARKPLLQHGQRLRPQAAFRKKIKMLRLHSYPNQAKTLEMRKIGEPSRSHIGKAWAKASVRPLVPAVAKVAGPCQFGSLPGRSTRDGKTCSRDSAGFLFDLEEKAFDTTPKKRPRAAVSDAQ